MPTDPRKETKKISHLQSRRLGAEAPDVDKLCLDFCHVETVSPANEKASSSEDDEEKIKEKDAKNDQNKIKEAKKYKKVLGILRESHRAVVKGFRRDQH